MASRFVLLVITLGIMIVNVMARDFTIVNQCKETIWPAIITQTSTNNSGGAQSFALKPGETAAYSAPEGWSGRIWARTGCNFDRAGSGTCQTGACGTFLNCSSPGSLPVSIAEFTIGEPDFYDVSLVDGFNLPIVVKPAAAGGKGNCSVAGCDGDLRMNCPPKLAVKADGKVVGCRSACDVFNTDEYCCRGTYGLPSACLPTNYSTSFKQICPSASTYAFDNLTNLITCSTTHYIVAFCTTRNQTVCSSHDHSLQCARANGASRSCNSWAVMLATHLMILLTKFLSEISLHS